MPSSILGHIKTPSMPIVASVPGIRVPPPKSNSGRSSFLKRFRKNDLEFGCAGDCEGTGGVGIEELDDLHEEAQEDIVPVSRDFLGGGGQGGEIGAVELTRSWTSQLSPTRYTSTLYSAPFSSSRSSVGSTKSKEEMRSEERRREEESAVESCLSYMSINASTARRSSLAHSRGLSASSTYSSSRDSFHSTRRSSAASSLHSSHPKSSDTRSRSMSITTSSTAELGCRRASLAPTPPPNKPLPLPPSTGVSSSPRSYGFI